MAHKAARDDLTADYVRSVLDYNPETGVLTWKKCPRQPQLIGKPAGYHRPNGKIIINIKFRYYLAHRLIWLIMTGEWPTTGIDHRDHDGSNNRWNNLRLATQSQNIANAVRSRRNTSGFKGVHFFKKTGRYQAYVGSVRNKRENLGYFDTAEEAFAAYCKRAKELYGDFHSPG
jgi:hypothetical protein